MEADYKRVILKISGETLAGDIELAIHAASAIDPWFLRQIRDIVDFETVLKNTGLRGNLSVSNPEFVDVLRKAKVMGFSDRQLASIWKRKEIDIRSMRKEAGIIPAYKLVDTCAAEFEAYTPYYYSAYETENEARTSDRRKVVILGGGPNRIGQGIEFD